MIRVPEKAALILISDHTPFDVPLSYTIRSIAKRTHTDTRRFVKVDDSNIQTMAIMVKGNTIQCFDRKGKATFMMDILGDMVSIKLLLICQCFEMGLDGQRYHRRRRIGKIL